MTGIKGEGNLVSGERCIG